MHQINLLDETFDKNQSHHYNLSIQTSSNGISFSLFDTIKNKFVVFRYYPVNGSKQEDLSCLMTTDEILKLHFKTVNLLVTEGKSTLVPVSFFDESKIADLFRFNLGQEKDQIIYSNNLPSVMAVNIFSYHRDFVKKLKEHFPKMRIYHRSSPFLEHLIEESAKWQHNKCYVSIYDGIFDIALASQKKLAYFNSFTYKDKNDIIYYILSIADQFKLSMVTPDIYFSADINNHDQFFEYLSNYLQQVRFITPSDKFTYSYTLDEFQLTRFSNLFNVALCV